MTSLPTDRNNNHENVKLSYRNQPASTQPPGGLPIHSQNKPFLQTQKVAERILSTENKENKAQIKILKPNPQNIWSNNPFTKRSSIPSVSNPPIQQSSQLPSSIPLVQPSSQLPSFIPSVQPLSQLPSSIPPVQPSSRLPSSIPPAQPSIPLIPSCSNFAPQIPLYVYPNDSAFYYPPVQAQPNNPPLSNFPFSPTQHYIPPFSSHNTLPISYSPPTPSSNRSHHPYSSKSQYHSPHQQTPLHLPPQSPIPFSTSTNTPSSTPPLTIPSPPSTPSFHSGEPPSPPLLPLNKNEIQKEQEAKILQPKPIIIQGNREKLTDDQIVIINKVILKRKSYILPDNPIPIDAFIEYIDKFFKNPSLKVSIHDKILMGSASTLPLDIRPFNDVDICYLINKEPSINFLDFFNKLLNAISTYIQKKVLENNNLFLKLDKITNEILINKIQIIDDEKGIYLAKYGLFGFDVTVVFYDTQLGQPCLSRDNVNTFGGFRISLIHNFIYCVDRNQIVNKNVYDLILIHFNQSFFTVNEPEKVERFSWRIVHAMRKGQEIDERLYPIALKQLLKKEFVKSDFEIHKMIVTNHIAHSNDYDIKNKLNHEDNEKSENEQNQKLSKEEKEKQFLKKIKSIHKTFNDHEGELIEFLNFCLFIGKGEDLSEQTFGWSKFAKGITSKIPGSHEALRHYHPALLQIATLIKDKPNITPSILHLIQGLLLFSSLDADSPIKCYVNSSKYQPEEIHSYFSYSFETKNGGNKTYYIYNNSPPLKLAIQYFTSLKKFESEGIEIEKILVSVFQLLNLPTDFMSIERKIQFTKDLLQRKLPLTSQKSPQITEKKTSKKSSHHQLERKEPFDRLNVIINQHSNDFSITQFLNELFKIDPTLCKHPLFLPLFTSLKLKLLSHFIGDKKKSEPLKQLINAVYHLYAKPNKNEIIKHLGFLHKSLKMIEEQSNIYKNDKHPLEYKEVVYALIMGLSHALSENDPEILRMLMCFSLKTYKKEYVISLLRAIFYNVKKFHQKSLQKDLEELFKLYINKCDETPTFSKQESELIFNILGFYFDSEVYDSCLNTMECLYIINANEFLKKNFSDEIVRLSLYTLEGISRKLQPENFNDFNKALKFVIEIEMYRILMVNIQKSGSSEQIIKEHSEFQHLRFQKYLSIVIEIFTRFFEKNNLRSKGLDHQNFVVFLKILERLVPLSQWGRENKIFILDSIRTSQNYELIKWGISKIPFLSANLKLQIFIVRIYSFELIKNYRYQYLPLLKQLCRLVNYSDPLTVSSLINFLSHEFNENDFTLAMYALKRVYLTTWKDIPISEKHRFLYLVIDYFNILSQKTKNKEIALLSSKFILNSLLKGLCKDLFKTHAPQFCNDLIILFLTTQNIEFIDLACWLLVKAGGYDNSENMGNLYMALFQFFSQIPFDETHPLESFCFAIEKLCFHFPALNIQYFPQESLDGPDKLNIFNLNHSPVPITYCNMIIHLYASAIKINDLPKKHMVISTADLLFNYYITLDHNFYLKKLEYEFRNNKIQSSSLNEVREQPKIRVENFNVIFSYYAMSQSSRYPNGELFLQDLTLFINTQIHEDWQKSNCLLILYDQIDGLKFDNLDLLLDEFNKLLPYLSSNKILGWKLFYFVSHKLINSEHDLKKSYEWLRLIENSTLLIDNSLEVKNHPNYPDLRNSIANIYLTFLDSLMVNLHDLYFFNSTLNCLQKFYIELDGQDLFKTDAIIERGFILAFELLVCSFVHKNSQQFDQLILLLKNIFNRFEYSDESQFRWLFNFIIEEIILIPLVFEKCTDFKMNEYDEDRVTPPKEHKNHPIFGIAPIVDILNNKPWEPLASIEPEPHDFLNNTNKPILSKKFLNFFQVNYLLSELGTREFRSKIIEKLNQITSKIQFKGSIREKVFANIVYTILKRIPDPQDRKRIMDQEFRDSLYLQAVKFMNTLLLTKPFRNSDPARECVYLLYIKDIFSHLTINPDVPKGINRLLAVFFAKQEALKKQNTILEDGKKGKTDSKLLQQVLFHSNISAPGTLVAQGSINCGVFNLSEIAQGVIENVSKGTGGDSSNSSEEIIGVREAKEAKTSRKSAKKNKKKKNKNVP